MQQKITIALFIGAVLLFVYFLFTGSDPLGLFSEPEDTVTTFSEEAAGELADGGWWEVYFTDPGAVNDAGDLAGTVPGRLIGLIDGAQESIHIAAFEFDLAPVAEALKAARRRGVEVAWVTDDEYGIEEDEDENGYFADLMDAGIQVIGDGRSGLMHNKFWIFDRHTVWTGSTNITENGYSRNNNNVIVIRSPRLAAIYEREFDEMWAGEFGVTSPSTVNNQSVTIDGTPIRVFFAAEDEVATELVPLVEAAEMSIRFMAFSFTHDELGAVLLTQAERGVDVAGIFETRGSQTEYSEMPALYCAGVPVRQDGNPGTFHHKVFVIDGRTVITGSYNFTENADSSNDENVIVIADETIASRYLQEFRRRWAEAVEPDAAELGCN